MSDWDWDEQKADTEGTVRHLAENEGVAPGTPINLDIQTVAGAEAGPLAKAAYLAALSGEGYAVEVYTDDEGVETIEIAIAGVPFDADEIWRHERAVSEIALRYQWQPDGWGFWELDETPG